MQQQQQWRAAQMSTQSNQQQHGPISAYDTSCSSPPLTCALGADDGAQGVHVGIVAPAAIVASINLDGAQQARGRLTAVTAAAVEPGGGFKTKYG